MRIPRLSTENSVGSRGNMVSQAFYTNTTLVILIAWLFGILDSYWSDCALSSQIFLYNDEILYMAIRSCQGLSIYVQALE